MSSISYTLTREVNGEDGHEVEIPVTVEYTWQRFCGGVRDGRGGPLISPDEPAHAEIDSVTRDDNGEPIETTEDENERIESAISEQLADAACDEPPDREDYNDYDD